MSEQEGGALSGTVQRNTCACHQRHTLNLCKLFVDYAKSWAKIRRRTFSSSDFSDLKKKLEQE